MTKTNLEKSMEELLDLSSETTSMQEKIHENNTPSEII